ncbi:MAG: universal stress protein [Brevundimonas sp.]|uniref:universal stress protein n=1 Tax=Brevundimonas sp. TaxID=1871086 RepID=UPI00271E98DB|nr:universal stress protein [Brevundimonas sp.]MDO9587291.1 universal stress protein [Brevundimonas sp.]MDP3658165.1 universal stress protein [Brevundimonas sp.]MDZ4110628.1 universal stress protein [Brevundimonas sp.]
MSLKHMIAIAAGEDGDGQALGLASSLASQHDGVVEVLPIYPDSAADMIALGMTLGATMSPEAVEDLAAAERGLQARIEETARSAANQADVVFGPGEGAPRMSVLGRGLRPARALNRHTTLADLVVFGQGHLDSGLGGDVFAQCLLSNRAPVLVARHDADSLSGPAAIAWDGSPQAGRAVKAALPLLAMASEIHVVQCVNGLDRDATDPDIDSLNAYLKLHGVGEGASVLVEGEDEGAALVAAAQGKSATLLVAGAWGHSRLRQAIFGGATRAFLRCKTGPNLLLTH